MSESLFIKPVCLTEQDVPCLLSFDCGGTDSPVVSDKIISHFSNNEFDYLMPDCNKHEYVFSKNNLSITCYLYREKIEELSIQSSVTVCVVPSIKDPSVHKLFCDLRDAFRPVANKDIHLNSVETHLDSLNSKSTTPSIYRFTNLSALDIILKHY